MQKAPFFAFIRDRLFDDFLDHEQVTHIEAIVDAAVAAEWPLVYTAYALATAHHETARFKHLNELGGPAYFTRMYDIAGKRPRLAQENGNIHPGDGPRYKGRGYVHLTWRNNYRRAGKRVGIDLEKYPDMAAEPNVAARVMIEGMQEGWFTGRAMHNYLNGQSFDYRAARRIINGTDKADLIAGYARAFDHALRIAGYGDPSPKSHPPVQPVAVPPPVPTPAVPAPAAPPSALLPPAPKPSFWARFAAALIK